MKITFLGTASMQPTRERNLSAILLSHDSENILIDCGEGTQRQMKLANVKPTKITRIIISHFHADHVLGLGGLFRNLAANGYNKTLNIHIPRGTSKFLDNIINSAYYNNDLKLNIDEFDSGQIFENDKMHIEAFPLSHTVPSFGFVFMEKPRRKINLSYTSKFGLTKHPMLGELQKGRDIIYNNKNISAKKATILVPGKKLGIILDTCICNNCYVIADNADLLVAESTFSSEHADKAKEYKHMTSTDAASIAKKAKSKKLILTHFSQRYKDDSIILAEAKKIFKNTTCAKDFLEVEL